MRRSGPIRRRTPLKRGKPPSRRARKRRQPAPLARYRKTVQALDVLFSKRIRERDGGRCVLCGSTSCVQCAHLFSRRYKNTRWDPENAWTLCDRQHLYYTHRPLEWDDLLRQRLGGGYECLRARARILHKQDLELIRVSLARPFDAP